MQGAPRVANTDFELEIEDIGHGTRSRDGERGISELGGDGALKGK